MSLTIAETRVDAMQRALIALVRLEESRLPGLERELAEIRIVLNEAAKAIYDATLYDPDGERNDAG